jgi:hypothetical protein
LLYFFFFCKYFICLIPNALTTFTNNFVIIVLFRSRRIGQEHHSQTNEDSSRWRIQRRVSLPRFCLLRRHAWMDLSIIF